VKDLRTIYRKKVLCDLVEECANMSKKAKSEDKGSQIVEDRLSQIEKYTRVVAAQYAVRRIMKLASTPERKTIWAYCSGKLTREEISSKTGIVLRTVSHFIDLCKTFGLVEEEKEKGGHPKRVIDYVPSGWKKTTKGEKQAKETKTEITTKSTAEQQN